MTTPSVLAWLDCEGDGFRIDSWDDPSEGIACLTVSRSSVLDSHILSVFVDEADALALIDWLQRRVRQVSSHQSPIPHTDAPVKDDTK